MSTIRPGKYRHYKGKEYEVYGTARHTETEECFVVYRCLYGNFDLWIRPYDAFVGTVETEQGVKPRFEYMP